VRVVDGLHDPVQAHKALGRAGRRPPQRVAESLREQALLSVLQRACAGDHPRIRVADPAQSVTEHLHPSAPGEAAVENDQHRGLVRGDLAMVTAGEQLQQIGSRLGRPAQICGPRLLGDQVVGASFRVGSVAGVVHHDDRRGCDGFLHGRAQALHRRVDVVPGEPGDGRETQTAQRLDDSLKSLRDLGQSLVIMAVVSSGARCQQRAVHCAAQISQGHDPARSPSPGR